MCDTSCILWVLCIDTSLFVQHQKEETCCLLLGRLLVSESYACNIIGTGCESTVSVQHKTGSKSTAHLAIWLASVIKAPSTTWTSLCLKAFLAASSLESKAMHDSHMACMHNHAVASLSLVAANPTGLPQLCKMLIPQGLVPPVFTGICMPGFRPRWPTSAPATSQRTWSYTMITKYAAEIIDRQCTI